METDATEANKEKTPEEIEQERAKLTAESNNNYVKALEAEGALIYSIETALSGVSLELPEDKRVFLKPLQSAILLKTAKYKHLPPLHGATSVTYE